MATLNDTPSSNRLHIGVFGKTNSGKSSFINALTGQQVSIVADVAGTTTDPVYKPMEILPLGPCVLIDTAGFDDISELGMQRMEKTALAAEKTDIAVIVIDAPELSNTESLSSEPVSEREKVLQQEREWYQYFAQKHTPVVIVVNKCDRMSAQDISEKRETVLSALKTILASSITSDDICMISTKTGYGIDKIKTVLARKVPENYGCENITGGLVSREDLVILVMPQDIQAPKGRLILPQVQTIRELLDKKCHVMCVTTDEFENVLTLFNKPPKLIITDSQVFDYVYQRKPKESMLTSFSVLFAAYKGDIEYYIEGAKAIDALTPDSKVLIAECCTHAPLSEDIGREKLPRMLRKRVGKELQIDMVSGTDFPEDLSDYDLVIQCGACMFNRKYVMSRIERARTQGVAMTNYGVTIAHINGILQQVVY